MKIAGEITEFEESFLQQLILEKDPSVRETLRRYSLYTQTALFHLVATVSPSFSFYTQRMVIPICSQRRMKNMQPIFRSTSPKSLSSSSSSSNVHPSSNCTLRFMTKTDRSLCPRSPQRMHCISIDSKFRNTRRMTSLPPLFKVNETLCGLILKRVTSKKIFKKWNRCVFVVKPSFLQLYRTADHWKRQGPIYWQTNIHSFMVAVIGYSHSARCAYRTQNLRQHSHLHV